VKTSRLLLALLLGATALGPAGSPAYAATITITCTGTSAISYTPGLLFTVRSVAYTETDTFGSCLSTGGPTITSGSASAGATLDGSCLGLPVIVEDPAYTVHWSDGQSSTFALTFTDTIVAGVENVTGAGTVTSGAFTGATGVFQWVYLVPNPLQCLANPGVTSQSGPLLATVILP
jgi:hypothetical protein